MIKLEIHLHQRTASPQLRIHDLMPDALKRGRKYGTVTTLKMVFYPCEYGHDLGDQYLTRFEDIFTNQFPKLEKLLIEISAIPTCLNYYRYVSENLRAGAHSVTRVYLLDLVQQILEPFRTHGKSIEKHYPKLKQLGFHFHTKLDDINGFDFTWKSAMHTSPIDFDDVFQRFNADWTLQLIETIPSTYDFESSGTKEAAMVPKSVPEKTPKCSMELTATRLPLAAVQCATHLELLVPIIVPSYRDSKPQTDLSDYISRFVALLVEIGSSGLIISV